MTTGKSSHDQNFKNLILDYPHQALAFFAAAEARDLQGARITPIRQEQLKQRLSDRFHELDVPLQVDWPDGRREALLFVLEEQSDPARFSLHRLAHYCLDLAELCRTRRVVPVVIFLRGSERIPGRLDLGSEQHTYLAFHYLRCLLAGLPAERYLDSDNLVARLNLPSMRWQPERKVEIYAQAIRGLLTLERDPEKQLKYIDFIDIYAALDENEQRIYRERFPQEDQGMAGLTERLLEQGKQQGIQQGLQAGIQRGEQTVLSRQLVRRFGPLTADVEQRLRDASPAELERWAENVLDAASLDEVFGAH